MIAIIITVLCCAGGPRTRGRPGGEQRLHSAVRVHLV